MAIREQAAGVRIPRSAAPSVSVPEIAANLQVPESVVRTYLAAQTFRGVRLTFTRRQEQRSRRAVRQWRQRPLKLKGMEERHGDTDGTTRADSRHRTA
ncbi:MAG: hypothetical protein LC793_16860 [Thermomicrobia bacterium]|nr:hypothetical protein [Thermomicrobia bacterium]MCA1724608.1 hypothetical protein [Thermomicrobia bacterium]